MNDSPGRLQCRFCPRSIWNTKTPRPMADKYESSTEPMRYSGATTARNNPTRIRNTMMMVAKTMKPMSSL